MGYSRTWLSHRLASHLHHSAIRTRNRVCSALLRFAQLCVAQLCFALLCLALLLRASLSFALLCFAQLRFILLCFAWLCPSPSLCVMSRWQTHADMLAKPVWEGTGNTLFDIENLFGQERKTLWHWEPVWLGTENALTLRTCVLWCVGFMLNSNQQRL